MKAFLPEVIYIRYASWEYRLANEIHAWPLKETHGIPRVSCTFDIRLLIGVHRSSLVPTNS